MADIPAHIRPGRTFRDTDGHVAQLHGVGILRVGDRWYAWGEDKTHGSHFQGIACYTSEDLVQWTRQPDALPVSDGDLGPDKVVERPKVLRRGDGFWVMVMHVDTADYSYARVGYAIAETPAGPFRYVRSERPLGNLSRDIGVFQDKSGSYLLSEDRDAGLHIYRLAEDLLSVESLVVTLHQERRPEFGYESPALVHHDGVFYAFGSDLTGWSTNDNVYATASALTGPWSPWRTFARAGTRTFDSQISTVVPIQGGHMYVGDRWNPDQLGQSAAVWLPLDLAAGEARVHWRDRWHPKDVRP